jgi:hypothetical protein
MGFIRRTFPFDELTKAGMVNMLASQFATNYMSMPPGNARGLSSFGSSEIRASVVSIRPAIDAAFCNAQRVTFADQSHPLHEIFKLFGYCVVTEVWVLLATNLLNNDGALFAGV